MDLRVFWEYQINFSDELKLYRETRIVCLRKANIKFMKVLLRG